MKQFPKTGKARSPEYDYWMAYYDKTFHNKPPSELTSRAQGQKLKLREWLSQQQTMRRKPTLVQGMIPEDGAKTVRLRFRQRY